MAFVLFVRNWLSARDLAEVRHDNLSNQDHTIHSFSLSSTIGTHARDERVERFLSHPTRVSPVS